jgi:hypothetical protein
VSAIAARIGTAFQDDNKALRQVGVLAEVLQTFNAWSFPVSRDSA